MNDHKQNRTYKEVDVKVFSALLFICAICMHANAQNSVRPETRVVNHWQKFADDAKVGLAAYANEPDGIHGGPRAFLVFGPAFRDENKTRWLEVMAGGLASRTGFDPAIDVRAQARLQKLAGLTLWGECLHLFKSERTLLSSSLTKTFAKRLKVGVEADTWLQKSGNTTGIGPGAGFIINRHFQIWHAYQFGLGKQRDISRTYMVFNW